MKNRPIAEWEAGDRVQGFALLARKELRTDRNGRQYLDLELRDASGFISGKVWADSPALEAEFEASEYVAFEGTVTSYRERLQINVRQCRRTEESDRGYGFDESRLVPTTTEDLDELWRRLEETLETELVRDVARRLARETLEVHGEELREHAAAKRIHHAYRGGLLEHVVSMLELAVAVCDHYGDLDRDQVLLGVLFHDLGKLLEIGAMPANDYTPVGRLVGHVVLGRDMLRERCAAIEDFPSELQLELEHLVLSHQGHKPFGSPVEPMTAEALVLHAIDDLDSKLNQLRGVAREKGTGYHYLKPMERTVYLREGEPASLEESPPEEEPEEEPGEVARGLFTSG